MERRPLASAQQVAEYLDVPIKTLYRWHQQGTGPRMARIGKHLKARWTDVDAWLESRTSGGRAA